MKNSKLWLSAVMAVAVIVLCLGIFVTSISSNAVAQTSCSNDRCDYRNGQSYGCILSAEGKKCKYQGGTCTGWDSCEPSSDIEVN